MRKKEIEALDEKIKTQEAKKMENKTRKPAPPPKKAPDRTPQQPPLPPEKAKAIYRFHHAEAAKIKAGKSPKEIADLTALRIRACGHDIHDAMQIMADDPNMREALTNAYTPEGTARLQKLAPFAHQMRAQERQAIAGTAPQKQHQPQPQTGEKPCAAAPRPRI